MHDQHAISCHRASHLQVGLLFDAVAAPGRGVYVQQIIVEPPEGSFAADAYRAAWERLVERHAALRTTFRIEAGGEDPQQVIHPHVEVAVAEYDWRALPAARREVAWTELLGTDRGRGFPPDVLPLWRLTTCRLGEDEHRILWSYHHALLDGRSRLLLLEELLALHAAQREGIPADLPAPVSREPLLAWLDRGVEVTSGATAFWRDALAGQVAPTALPARAPHAGQATVPGAGEVARRLPAELSAHIRRLAHVEEVTTATILQGAWALLLAQEAGEDDVVLGTTRAGRASLPFDASGVVGLLMTTVPARVRIPEAMSVGPWLRELRAASLAVRPFEHVSLVDVQRATDVRSRRPLFESLFAFERGSMNTLVQQAGPSEARWSFRLEERLGYPLGLNVYDEERIVVKALVDGERVDLATATRLLDRYQRVLAEMAEGPGRPVAELGLLTDAERSCLGRRAPLPDAAARGGTIVARFERRVAADPGARALRAGGVELTYAELSAGANRIAHRLRALGVGAESLVAVRMRRSPAAVMALLGVLKAGGAYVPLDPSYPSARLAFMLEDSRAAVLLTDAALPPDGVDCPVVLLDDRLAVVADESEANPEEPPAPRDLAYVIYTSGSTGRPKGVAIEHRSAAALVDWAGRAYTSAELARVLAATSLSFDLSVFELFAPLCAGGSVILVDDLFVLADAPEGTDPTLVNTVPSALGELLLGGALPASVRTVNLAGEPLGRDLVHRLYREPGVRRVVNLYGPTEDTTYSTVAECAAHDPSPPSIGRPIDGGEAYVLDARGHEVAPGVVGEIHLGGAGLARGYLHRPELTAERFVSVSLEGSPTRRLYRTGDLGCWRPDGALDYGGRADAQVKVRGHRIEPGEVETALLSHPGVSAAAVIAEDGGPDRRLLAYVVGSSVEPAALRRHLRDALPDFMVPSAIVPLEALPLTSNGKLDRGALPSAVATTAAGRRLSTRERAMAELWREILELPELPAPEDDFFELGGHSFRALRLLALIEERLGRRPPLDALFRSSSLADLTGAVATSDDAARGIIPVHEGGSRPPWFGVMTDRRGVLALRRFRAALGAEQPVYGLEAMRPEEGTGSESSIEAIAARCVSEVRGVQPHGPYHLGGHSIGGLVAYAMACELEAIGEPVGLLVLLDTVAPDVFRLRGRVRARRRELRGLGARARMRLLGELSVAVGRRAARRLGGERAIVGPGIGLRGFEDPFDQARAAALRVAYRPASLGAPLAVLWTPESAVLAGSATLGWVGLAGGPVEAISVPGHHVSILAEPDVGPLSAALAQRLVCAQRMSPEDGGGATDAATSLAPRPVVGAAAS